MARIALGLEYDGADFVGWQLQREGRTVQAAVEAAVAAVADAPVTIHAAGRTDAGVHAAQQVVHFDTEAHRSPRQWVLGINANLPDDVAVLWSTEVEDGFDARRSALWRRYRYRILQQPTRSALERRRSWWVREPLDVAAMTAAAVAWLGEHDFSAFRAAGCQSKTPMRRLIAVALAREGPMLAIDFKANAFLQHMVRNLVGALVEIGHGAQAPSWAGELMLGRDRRLGGVTAPPQGLTLAEIAYPAEFALPIAAATGGIER
ncbi:MAG TPA: tRNA pseudouridine(38-40) synthase TruA [Gammaproteobacteria bacterium]|nr:tRNA pseudouridine(38-40) synthase TruA [Gammaproteobacteria bacterium]